MSQSAWGLNGIQLQATAATYTDSSTAGSGTATNAVFNSFAQPTLAATNASVTTTNAANVYIAAAPTAGTNQTITNAYALWVDAGTTRLDGDVVISGSTNATVSSATALTVAKTGTNYALQVDTSTASAVTGVKITSTAAGTSPTLSVISSGTDEGLIITTKAAGLLALRPGSDSNTAIQMQNAAGTNIMNIDSSSNAVTVGTTNVTGAKFAVYDTLNSAASNTTFWSFTFAGQEINNQSATASSVAGLSFTMGSARNSVAGIGGIQESSTLGALGFFTGGSGRSNTVPERMRIDSAGNVGIGTSTMAGLLTLAQTDAANDEVIYVNTEESTATQAVIVIESDSTGNSQTADTTKAHFNADGSLYISLTGTETGFAVCHTNNGKSNNDELVDCTGTLSDYAEMYPTAADVGFGDLVISSTTMIDTVAVDGAGNKLPDAPKVKVPQLVKSTSRYQNSIIGIVSNNYNDFSSTGHGVINDSDHPLPIALSGRVPVKVSLENGPIVVGDYLTASSEPGKTMKATQPGMVVGQALASYSGEGVAEVMVFVSPFYYDPSIFISENGTVTMQRNTGTVLIADTDTEAAQVIDQQGSGDILQLQQNGVDRMLVQNNGSVKLNVQPTDAQDLVLQVKAGPSDVFTINARGDLAIHGVLIVKDDNFAGSIVTGLDGLAEVTFSYDLGTGKPVIQLTPEHDSPVFAQVLEWRKDELDRYTGFVIKAFSLDGSPTRVIVHYNVVAKQDSYNTYGIDSLTVIQSPNNNPVPSTNSLGNEGDGGVTPPDSGDVSADEGGSSGTVAGDNTTVNPESVSVPESTDPTSSSEASSPSSDASSGNSTGAQ
jgi:hypothetical protein